MAHILITLSLLFSVLLAPVSGYGGRGAAERILYYTAYLAEELTVLDEADQKVGVGCRGHDSPRCNFQEFCEYIWRPREDGSVKDNIRPKMPLTRLVDPKIGFWDIRIITTYNKIMGAKGTNTKYGYTNNVDGNRVYKGATSYYDALSKIGGPIGDLTNMDLPEDPDERKKFQGLIDMGQNAAQLVYDLRYKDMEPYRIRRVAQILGIDVSDIKTKPGRMSVDNIFKDGWNTIDVPKTITANQEKMPDIKDKFQDAMKEYLESPRAKDHWAAICAADSAQRLSGCGTP